MKTYFFNPRVVCRIMKLSLVQLSLILMFSIDSFANTGNSGNSEARVSFSWHHESLDSVRHNISGKVIGEDGLPIIGANVSIAESNKGTTTDFDGNFSLENVNIGDVILISYVGYISIERVIKNKTEYVFTLKEDSKTLDEVVVIGYGTVNKKDLTGSVSSIKTKDLEDIPTASFSNLFVGRAPGISTSKQSDFAGANSFIRLRGSGAEPLFVIDNVVKRKDDFDALDPNEVEDISILKDVASAAIYGMKSADGVILITTKSGKKNTKATFNYKTMFSFQEANFNTNDYTAYDEMVYRNNYERSNGREPYYTKEEIAYVRDNNINYNINDIIWKNPKQQQHNISASGGNDKTSYYFMAGFHNSESSYDNTNYNRYNFRSNITSQITNFIKLNVNVSGNQRIMNRFFWPYDLSESLRVTDFYSATFSASRLYPWYVDQEGNPLNERTKDALPVVGSSLGFHPGENVYSNGSRKFIDRNTNAIVNLDVDLSGILDGLSTNAWGNYSFVNAFNKTVRLHQQFYRPALDPNLRVRIDPSVPVSEWGVSTHTLGQSYENLDELSSFSDRYQFNWFGKYDQDFGAHSINLLSGVEIRSDYGYAISGTAYKLLSESVQQIFATSSSPNDRQFSGRESTSAFSSWISRINYGFKDKYLFNFTLRYDGNYRFNPDNRWGWFPSASFAWRISDEEFINIPSLSNLKFRINYGKVGFNDGSVTPFSYQNNFRSGSSYVLGGTLLNGIQPGSIPNPDITWALTSAFNIGFDFGFWDNRLEGEIDYFFRKNSDVIGYRYASLPTTWGGYSPGENFIEDQVQGVDLALRYSDNIGEFSYDVSLNIGYDKDKTIYVDEIEGIQDWRSRIGKSGGMVFGYHTDGIVRDQAVIDALPEGFTQFGRKPEVGLLLFKDIRGANYSEGPDGKIDANDMDLLSTKGYPRINYGFSFNLGWRGLNLNMLWQGVGNHDRMIETERGDGVFQVPDRPYFGLWTDHWSPDNPDAKYPAPKGSFIEAGNGASTFWLKNGAYLRLKNIQLSYALPLSIIQSVGINKFSVFVSGTNLLTFSEMTSIMDPEQYFLDSYPIMKSYTAGVSITF